jgi:hypothetical protein
MTSAPTVTTTTRTRNTPAVPLVIGEHHDCVAEVIALGMTLGVQAHHVDRATGTGKLWRAAPLVIVRPDAARSVYRSRLPRRPGVILLCASFEEVKEVDGWSLVNVTGASYLVVWPAGRPWLADRFATITP